VVQAMERWIPGLVGLSIFGIPTAYLLYLAVMSAASRRWPVAAGRVTVSRVIPRRRGGGDYDVRYEYRVDGRSYQGTRVRWGGALNSNAADAEDTRSTYPAGREVQVRYRPGSPEVSTLETRASRAIWIWIVLGTFICISIGGALAGLWE